MLRRWEGAAGSLERPGAAFRPLQARGFNLITCFICANLFFNQSCSARRKEATVGSFAPSCSKGEVNGSYPGWRCLRGCGPGSPFVGGCLAWTAGGFQPSFPPQHHATSPRFRHRAARLLPHGVFETRCLVRTLCGQRHAGGPGRGMQHGAGRAAGRAAGRGQDTPARWSQGFQ